MTILYCTDLSEPPPVTQKAAQFAERMQGQLLVLHVRPGTQSAPTDAERGHLPADPATGIGGFTPYALYEPELEEDVRKTQEQAFHHFLSSRFEEPVRAALRHGDPAEVILDDAEEHDADYIVMGKHRRGNLERLLLGSVTRAVLKRSTRPVLLLPILKERHRAPNENE